MNKVFTSAVVAAGFVLTLGGAASWGQVPSTNDKSDASNNTGGGTGALGSSSLSGTDNTAYGFAALNSNTTGSANTAFGFGVLESNLAGSNNTAAGFHALVNNTANDNTAFGTNALATNTGGSNNTADGFDALTSNTTGSNNTAVGFAALSGNTTGGANTAYGFGVLESNVTGTQNTAVGFHALVNSTTTGNTALGTNALANTATGSRNIAVGVNAGVHLVSGDRNIYLGHSGVDGDAHTMRLRQLNNQTQTFIAGIRGVNVGSTGLDVVINSDGQLGTAVSSARYKRDIQAMGESSQGLFSLRPVTFRYKHERQGPQQYGLIAEEVEKVYPELVVRGAKGEVESVQYRELIPMLLNEVQHQQQALTTQAQQVAELKAQNESLQAALVQQNAAVAARLERLEEGAPRAASLTSH